LKTCPTQAMRMKGPGASEKKGKKREFLFPKGDRPHPGKKSQSMDGGALKSSGGKKKKATTRLRKSEYSGFLRPPRGKGKATLQPQKERKRGKE